MEKIRRGFSRLIHWQYFPLLVLLLIVVGLHFATITRPNEPLFDEQHYVPDARRIINGEGTLRVEHPPLAKLIIAGGIEVFGDNPWGWRMPAVILSTIALIAFYDVCRKLGTSHKTAFLATFLLSLENLMFIHSGMAMLDIYVVVFTIFAFWFYLKGSRWWWAAAISVALAGLSKLGGVLAIIPIVLHWFLIGYKPNMGNAVEPAPSAAGVTEPSLTDGPFVEQAKLQTRVIEPTMLETSAAGEIQTLPLEDITALMTEGNPPSDVTTALTAQTEREKKTGFWAVYSKPIIFILSMAIAPIAFFLLYGVFDMIIWNKWIPFVVWGQWNLGTVGDIRNALTLTNSITFTYGGAFPARPWEWVLSPTGSFYFYGWIFHPNNYENILLPYWYTPSYTGILSPSLWLSGLFVIPISLWKSFKKRNNASRNAWIFTLCWLIGTWVMWIALYFVSRWTGHDRITYMFYYLPTVGAIALGTALIITAFLNKYSARTHGFRKHFWAAAIASFLLFHLLCFCVISPLHLWISIPVSTILLLFVLWYLGFGRRFNIEFFVSAASATLVMRFVLYWMLRGWLVTGNAPWGLPEVSMLWVVSTLIGLAITWIVFAIIHIQVNRIIRDNASPPLAADKPMPIIPQAGQS